MINNKVVAIIPARGGSKRIPNKNIKLFAGQPVISYSIRVAREAGLFDRIIVSTDSLEIAAIAREFEAEVPFQPQGQHGRLHRRDRPKPEEKILERETGTPEGAH